MERLRCNCIEFESRDPCEDPPKDHIIFKHYVSHGPLQPLSGHSKYEGSCFPIELYSRFKWLEYSLRKQSAFCFFCRLFTNSSASLFGGHADKAFSETGFDNWKKALEKDRGFHSHKQSKTHSDSERSYLTFMCSKPIDTLISNEVAQQQTNRSHAIIRNRKMIGKLFSIVKLLGKLSLPFRGHDESIISNNRGVYIEFVHFLANNGDDVLNEHLTNSSKNQMYLSPQIQNEMISIIGNEIRSRIVGYIKEAGIFAVLMDETTDVSHKEQLTVIVRYVNPLNGKISESFVALLENPITTGEEITNILIEKLNSLGLQVEDIVGQGYDGGSNMSGIRKGVQARIRELNPLALFTHCYSHSLNRVLVNSVCNHRNIEASKFFGIVELVYTFIEGSAQRHGYFIERQREIQPDQRPLHLVGLSDTRWNCRASSCQRLLNEVVFKSVLDTIEHVCATTTDGNSRGTATGLLASVSTFNFVISLVTVTPILLAINIISETLQSCQIDLLTANKQIHVLKIELQRLRTENVWLDAFSKAENFAIKLGLNTEFSTQRSRRVSCRVDNNPSTGIIFSPKDNLRVNFYEALVDSMISEINSRFPNQLINFAFLDPRNFEAIDAEENLLKLVHQYKKISPDRFIAEWKLARHFIKQDTPLLDVYNELPHSYTELRYMYRILYTLPVTTAHAERSFSKLSSIKTKLRSTMCEDRLESLMFCSIEKEILLSLDNEDLISKFVSMADRRLQLS